jgi:hypothetical protein
MVRADVALFKALGHYWEGMAQIQSAELDPNQTEGLKKAAGIFQQALDQIKVVRRHEEQILTIAQTIEFSAYFVRRHEVASQYTEALFKGLEVMTRDLTDGYYPAAACVMLNRVLAPMMGRFEQDARIEGVLNRFERSGTKP